MPAIAALALAGVMATAGPVPASLTLYPAKVAPASAVTIHALNSGKAPEQLTAYGAYVVRVGGRCVIAGTANWVHMNPSRFRLAAGQTQPVQVRLDTAGLKPGNHDLALSVAMAATTGPGNVKVIRSVAALMPVHVAGHAAHPSKPCVSLPAAAARTQAWVGAVVLLALLAALAAAIVFVVRRVRRHP